MAKGIRQYVEQRFTKLLPKMQDMGGTNFRAKIINDAIAQFDISVASAAAAYNFVIQKMREENPKAVAGLGRTDQGLNVVAANAGRGGQRRRSNVATELPEGNVTLVSAKTGDEVVPSIPRKLAQTLIDNSGSRGRGNGKLVIKQDQEEEAEA